MSRPISDNDREVSNKYYRAYYDGFLAELHKLEVEGEKNTGFRRDDRLIGMDGTDDNHIQFKLVNNSGETFIHGKDKNFYYEFLIEFDKQRPEYGIYYGCRVLIQDGDLQDGIDILADEWDTLKSEVCRALNNTFLTKDFSNRFRITNNADNRFFWPFWISLDLGEDIVQVAVRATRIIAAIYKRYLGMDSQFYQKIRFVPQESQLITAFTKARFEQNIQKLKLMGEDKPALYKKFISGLKNYYSRPLIVRDESYEYAWRCSSLLSNELFAEIISCFCVENGIVKTKDGKKSIPWEFFDSVFLTKNGDALSSIRKSYANSKNRKKDKEKSAEAYLMDMGLLNNR